MKLLRRHVAAVGHHRKVHGAVAQAGQDPGYQTFRQAQLNARVAFAKPLEGFAQHGEHQIRGQRHTHGARVVALRLLQFVLRQRHLAHHQLRTRMQTQACLGEHHAA